MFGYRRRLIYGVYPGEFFSSLLLMLLIGAIIFLIAFYISWYILLGFIAVGGLIGFIYALYVVVKAIINSIKLAVKFIPHRQGIIGKTEKILFVAKKAAQLALSDNLAIAKNAFNKSTLYKLISFRKWMWLVVAISVMAFGFLFILAVILANFAIIILLLLILLILILCAFILLFVIELVIMLYEIIKIIILQTRKNLNLSFFTLKLKTDYGLLGNNIKFYFVSLFRTVFGIWKECKFTAQMNLSSSSGYAKFSPIKWLRRISPGPLYFWAIVLTILFILIFLLMFILALVPIFIWTSIMKLISIIKP